MHADRFQSFLDLSLKRRNFSDPRLAGWGFLNSDDGGAY